MPRAQGSSPRRAVAGALVDLKSLPARLSDPARRAEPWSFVHNVGNGDFQAIGAMLLRNLQDHAGLRPQDRSVPLKPRKVFPDVLIVLGGVGQPGQQAAPTRLR